MEKTPGTIFNAVRQAVGKTHRLQANWIVNQMPAEPTWYEEYELTDEEKEGLGPVEQEVWKLLKTSKLLDLEQEIMDMMAAEITKEIDAEILKGMLSGTSTK